MVGGHDRHQSPAPPRPSLRFCNAVESAEFFNTTGGVVVASACERPIDAGLARVFWHGAPHVMGAGLGRPPLEGQRSPLQEPGVSWRPSPTQCDGICYFLCDVHVEQLQLDELYAVIRDLKPASAVKRQPSSALRVLAYSQNIRTRVPMGAYTPTIA
jgi:hypothetical protein